MDNLVTIKRVLNNNVIIGLHPTHDEVILIGKGIGFSKKQGDQINTDAVEKTFLLEDQHTQEKYKQMLPDMDEKFIDFMNDVMTHVEERMNTSINEHVHIALTDHIAFAIKRIQEGLDFNNPFLIEVKTLYPKEHEVAEEIVQWINKKFDIEMPDGEVGFIAMHIHSAVTNKKVSDINKHSQLIQRLTEIIESQLDLTIDHQGIDYHRLVQHLRRAIERVERDERVEERKKLNDLLKLEYPVCYNLSWKLMKVIQQELRKPVDEAEAIYLTIHLQRLKSE